MTVCQFQPPYFADRHCERRFTNEAIHTVSSQRIPIDCHASIQPFETCNDVLHNFIIQIEPLWIHSCNEFDFLCPTTRFELFLTHNRAFHMFVHLIPH